MRFSGFTRAYVLRGIEIGLWGFQRRYFGIKTGFCRNGETIQTKRNPIFTHFSSILDHVTAKVVQVIHYDYFIALEPLKTIFLLMGGAAELGGLAALRLFGVGDYGGRPSLERTG